MRFINRLYNLPLQIAVLFACQLLVCLAQASADLRTREDLVLVEEFIPVYRDNPKEEKEPATIFTDKLIYEFEQRYQDTFGYVPMNQQILAMNHYTEVSYHPGERVSVIEDGTRKQVYGEFIVKRLSEYHIDDYAKKNENLKSAYQVKQKLSNYDMQLSSGYKVEMRYLLSQNALNFVVRNPFNIFTRYSILMDRASFGPSRVTEQVLEFGYSLSKKTRLRSYFKSNAGTFSVVGEKRISSDITAAVTGKTYVNGGKYPEGSTLDRESLIFSVTLRL